MAIRRLPTPPHAITLTTASHILYEVELSAAPSRAWRTAFLRPPAVLARLPLTPEGGRLGLDGARVTFRTTPAHLHRWLRRIDLWIGYANSVRKSERMPGTCTRGRRSASPTGAGSRHAIQHTD